MTWLTRRGHDVPGGTLVAGCAPSAIRMRDLLLWEALLARGGRAGGPAAAMPGAHSVGSARSASASASIFARRV